MTKDNRMRVTVEINKNLLDWIEERQQDNTFASQSDGIRKCIQCSKRIYEDGDEKDILKYFFGKKI